MFNEPSTRNTATKCDNYILLQTKMLVLFFVDFFALFNKHNYISSYYPSNRFDLCRFDLSNIVVCLLL